MHVRITMIPESEEEQADIRVHDVTREVEMAADLLQNRRDAIVGSRDGEKFLLDPGAIYYFETVDDRTFAYTETETYEICMRLYELEAVLDARFFRSSKAQIVNISMIASVKSEMNGRMMAALQSGEKIIVSRGYVKELKRRLGL